MNKYIASAVMIATVLAGCSSPTVAEQKEELEATHGEWTHAQTELAIDLYMDGLKRESELLDRDLELRQSLKFFDENRCSRDVLSKRRAEIDSMRNILNTKRSKISSISR